MSTNEDKMERIGENVTIPNDVVSIPVAAYKGIDITSVTIEGNILKSIEAEAFYGCTKLEYFVIPQGVVSLGDRVFAGCKSLQYVVMPSSVVMIGKDVFADCNSNLVIVGNGNKAREAAATYGFALRADVDKVVKAFNNLRECKSKCSTRTFEIFGVQVSCSTTQELYDAICEYYDKTLWGEVKQNMYNGAIAYIPKGHRNFEQDEIVNFAIGDEFVPYEITRQRLEEYAVFLDSNAELRAFCEKGLKQLSNVVAEIRLKSFEWHAEYIQRRNKTTQMYNEGRAKGFSDVWNNDGYEVSIRMTENNCNRGYTEAIKNLLNEIEPCLALVVLGLRNAELFCLQKAGVIETNCFDDSKKKESQEILAQITDDKQDNRYQVGLALKAYPRNIDAFVYAIDHDYDCETLHELARFLNMKQDFFNYLMWNVTVKCNVHEAIVKYAKYEQYADLSLIYEMQASMTADEIVKLVADKEKLYTKKPITKEYMRAYASKKVTKIVTNEEWAVLMENGSQTKHNVSVSDVIPHDIQGDLSLIIDWLSNIYYEALQKKQAQYEAALSVLANSKDKKELQKAKSQLLDLGEYMSAKEKAVEAGEKLKKLKKRKVVTVVLSLLGVAVAVAAAVVVYLFVL